MNSWTPETTALIHSLGWALCHSLWQSLLIFIVLKTVLKFIPSGQSNVRYNTALAGLLGITVWFADTWIQYWQKLKGIAVLVTENTANAQLPIRSHVITVATPQANIRYDALTTFIYGLDRWLPVLVGIYACGLLFLLLRLCLGLVQTNSLRYQSVTDAGTEANAKLHRLQEQLGISKKVRLLYSAKVDVPMMLGTLKPIILFPLAMASRLSTEQLEAILLHELAHIKRHDYLINMIQTIIETILFFNPFVWLTSKIIRNEREHCCDDMVLKHTYPLAYAKALATLETSRFTAGNLSMGAAGTSKNHLLTRIKRIMELKPNQRTDNRIIAITLTAGVLLVSLICFSPSFAQDKKEKKKVTEKKPTRIWVNDEDGVTITDNGKTYKSLEELPQEARKRLYEDDKKNNTVIYYGKDGKKLVMKADSFAIVSAPKEVEEFAGDDKKSGLVIDDISGLANSKELQEQMDKAFLDIDWNELGGEIDKAMKDIDWKQIDEDVKAGLKQADAAIKEIDWKEIEKQIEAAGKKLDSIDHKKIRVELEKARAETKRAMIESRKAMADSRRAIVESRKALAESRRAIQQSRMEQRKAEMELRKVRDLERYRSPVDSAHIMLEKMKEDGILDTAYGYEMKMDDKELVIDNKKAPDNIHKKYLPYLKGKGPISSRLETSKSKK
ncbi:MAG: hypothetical protein EOP56_15950 [Sphingobacteriales bacterium]|nr:MAG: hypothetical protein EOP56_15950 [Sphingobacteriales bacterium]